MSKLPENQLHPDLLGVNATNPWMKNDSSSRMQMFAGHISQALVINGSVPRRCFTGVEPEYGKYTFSKKFPVNASVIKLIEKYRPKVGQGSIKENPTTLVFYENAESPMREVDVLTLERHHVLHQHFGFKYKFNSNVTSQLTSGANYPRGTIVADSPNVDAQGNYCYGIEANMAYCSIPGVIEDGIIISEDFIQKIKSKGFESRVESWGKNYYPLNLYGDKDNYKPFPDIGEKIRDDGLLFALRKYDDLLGPVEMTPEALREPDYTHDRLVYAIPNARVVDIDIHHSDNGKYPPTPVGMEAQTMKYYSATHEFYSEVLSFYRELRRKRKDDLRISPEFHRLLVEATGFVHDNSKVRVGKTYRRNPLDDWRVEVTFEYDVIPNIGFKLSGQHGNGSKLSS